MATDPTSWRGSYAGAIGLPQFMPSSWAKLAVDFDGDGRIDLRGSPADAIGSVAHYLQAFGWQRGQPTHYPVEQLPTHAPGAQHLVGTGHFAHLQRATVASVGGRLAHSSATTPWPLALVELHNGDPTQGGGAPNYVLGTDNFYAVTRYNWSSYYALAVLELGQAVQAQWLRQNAP